MAEKRISFSDIFAEDVFAIAAKGAEELLEALKSLDEQLRKLNKEQAEMLKTLAQQKPSLKSLQELDKASRQAENSLKALDSVQKALKRTEEQLKVIQSEHAKQILKLKDSVKEATAELRAQVVAERAAGVAAETLGVKIEEVENAYFKLADTLENLRTAYKNLAAAGKEGTPEAQRLLEEITKLDKKIKQIDYSVGQFQRNVGNYTGSIRDFFFELGKRAEESGGAIGNVLGFVRGLGTAFRSAGGGLRGIAAGVTLVSRAIATSGFLILLNLAGDLIGRLTDFLQGVGRRALGAITGETAEALRNVQAQLAATRERIEIEQELVRLELERKKIDGDGIAARKQELTLLEEEAKQRLKLLAIEEKQLRAQLERVRAELKDQERFGDPQKIEELGQKQVELEEKLADIANERYKLTEGLRIETEKVAALEKAEAARKSAELAKRKAELLEMLRIEEEAAKTKLEALEREHRQRMQLIADVERQAEAEKVLDADVRRAINEARLAEESRYAQKLAELRAESLEQLSKITLELQEKSFEQELAQLRAQFAERRAEIARLAAEAAGDKDALAAAEEARRVALEAERRAEIELRKKYISEASTLEEKAFEIELNKRAKEFDDLREFEKYKRAELLKFREQLLQKELDALRRLYEETGSAEVQAAIDSLEGQLELLRLQIRSATAEGEAIIDDTKQRLQALLKDTEKALDFVGEMAERQAARVQRRIEHAQAAIGNRISLLIAQAEAGSISAEASIAELEKRQSELEQQREALLRQQQRREAALAAFRSYAGALAQGTPPGQALLQVIRDFSVITQLIKSLPTYYRGTEYVPVSAAMLRTATDAVLARVHVGERIVPADINRRLGGIRNEDLPAAVSGAKVEFEADSFTNALSVIVRRASKVEKIKRTL